MLQKLPFSRRDPDRYLYMIFSGPPASPCPKRHLDRFSRFCRAHSCVQQTVTPRDTLLEYVEYVVRAMRPNSIKLSSSLQLGYPAKFLAGWSLSVKCVELTVSDACVCVVIDVNAAGDAGDTPPATFGQPGTKCLTSRQILSSLCCHTLDGMTVNLLGAV